MVGTVTLAANVAFYDAYFQPATGAGTALTLPVSPVWVVWIKNLSASLAVTVQFQVAGGALISQANSPVINPLSVFTYFNTSEAIGGMVGVTLTASSGGAPVEVLLAA